MDFNCFDRQGQRNKQKLEMTKNHALVKQKAKEVIAAKKIQRFIKKHINQNIYCKSKLVELQKKLDDIKKALSIERIREKFYMPLEKFIMLLRELCIGTKAVFQDLKSKNIRVREDAETSF